MVFDSRPAGPYGWDGDDDGLLFAEDAFLSGYFAQQSMLRIAAEEITRKGIADSRLRKPLEINRSSDCTEVEIEDSAIFLEPLIAGARLGGVAQL